MLGTHDSTSPNRNLPNSQQPAGQCNFHRQQLSGVPCLIASRNSVSWDCLLHVSEKEETETNEI